MDTLNTLDYDHTTGNAHFIEDGQAVTAPLDAVFTRLWIDHAYPGLDPELVDAFAEAIPFACRESVVMTTWYKTNDFLHETDPLFDRSGNANGRWHINDSPVSLRFPVWYAVLTLGLFVLCVVFPGRYLFRSIGRAWWHLKLARLSSYDSVV